jgi:hypothetical protein
MATAVTVGRVFDGEGVHAHLEEFRTDPVGLMKRIREECGDVGGRETIGAGAIQSSTDHKS